MGKRITPIAFFSFRHSIVRLFDCSVVCFLIGGLPVAAFSQLLDSAGSLKSGIAQFHEGNFEGAQVELYKAAELNPKNPSAFFYLAEAFFVLNDSKKAMENYNKAIALDSTHAKAYKGRGRVKAKREDYYGSIEDFTKAIELDKNYSDAFFNRGLSYLNLKDYKSAIADFSKVLKMNPKDFQAYTQRGTAQFLNGDKKRACSDWSKAGELGDFKIYDTIKKNCK